MNHVMHAELRKTRAGRASLALLGGGLLYAVLNGLATTAFAGRDGNAELGSAENLGHVVRGGGVAPWVVLLVAIGATAGEYRHRTISTTFLVTPRRGRVLVAKLLAQGALGALFATATIAIGLMAALPALLGAEGGVELVDAHVGRSALGLVATSALYGLAGVALGFLVRNPTVASVGAIAWLAAGENIIGSMAGWDVARWFPGQAAAAAAGAGQGRLLPMAGGAALFGAYALVAALAASRLTMSRDVT
jgi:ABC-2 type transport system permease protein